MEKIKDSNRRKYVQFDFYLDFSCDLSLFFSPSFVSLAFVFSFGLSVLTAVFFFTSGVVLDFLSLLGSLEATFSFYKYN